MTYSVVIDGKVAFIVEAERGRYLSSTDAIMAVMSAAKDIDITSININNTIYSTMDRFTGGLLNVSQIVESITGEKVANESIAHRLKRSLLSTLSTFFASLRFDCSNSQSDSNPRLSSPHRKEEPGFASPLNYRVFRSRR